MATFLKIENPGVCPVEGFILLGATSKRLADDNSPYTIGQFGSGNKHAVSLPSIRSVFSFGNYEPD